MSVASVKPNKLFWDISTPIYRHHLRLTYQCPHQMIHFLHDFVIFEEA